MAMTPWPAEPQSLSGSFRKARPQAVPSRPCRFPHRGEGTGWSVCLSPLPPTPPAPVLQVSGFLLVGRARGVRDQDLGSRPAPLSRWLQCGQHPLGTPSLGRAAAVDCAGCGPGVCGHPGPVPGRSSRRRTQLGALSGRGFLWPLAPRTRTSIPSPEKRGRSPGRGSGGAGVCVRLGREATPSPRTRTSGLLSPQAP